MPSINVGDDVVYFEWRGIVKRSSRHWTGQIEVERRAEKELDCGRFQQFNVETVFSFCWIKCSPSLHIKCVYPCHSDSSFTVIRKRSTLAISIMFRLFSHFPREEKNV